MEHGPRYGYFPSPSKSWYICKEADEPAAIKAFQQFNLPIKMTRRQAYIGGFIGNVDTKEEWLNKKNSTWTAAVETLSKIATRWPQTAYAGFTFCLKNEWQYVQRVVADVGASFEPLEKMIRTKFLPSLLGIPTTEIDGEYRNLLTHSVKTGGLAIRNPTKTADHNLGTLKSMTRHLVDSLVDAIPFSPNAHRRAVSSAGLLARNERLARERATLTERGETNHGRKRRDDRACKAGT